MRVLGVVPAYNEQDVIGNCVRAMLRCCDEVHVFDHGSEDLTPTILHQYVRNHGVNYHYVSRREIPPKDEKGRQSFELWHHLARFAIARADRFDWLVWFDADDLLRQPDGRLATHASIQREDKRGVDVIRPLIRIFHMSPEDDADEPDYLRRIRHYRTAPTGHAPRAWRIELTPPNLPAGAHVQDPATGPKRHPFYLLWPAGTTVSNNTWLLDQYPFRTQAQAEQKVLHDRNWITPIGKRRYQWAMNGGKGIRDMALVRRTRQTEDRDLEMP